jgi:folate/biopterin transporter
MRAHKRTVVACYFLLGACLEFPMLGLRYLLMTTYGIPISKVAVVLSTMSLPWTVKPLYGIISDNFPIFGQRRKPYIIACNLLTSGLWVLLSTYVPDQNVLTGLLVLISALTCFGDVMYDAAMVEISKTEEGSSGGSFQSWCWIARSAGALLSAITAGYLLDSAPPSTLFVVQATFPAFIALLVWFSMVEHRNSVRVRLKVHMSLVRDALRDPGLWKPALFVFVFAATPSSGTAWFYYLVKEKGFSPHIMGLLNCVEHASMLLGTVIYRQTLRSVALRPLFVCLVFLSALLSLTPLILVRGWNEDVGIPAVFFVAGDDIFLDTLGQIAMMPCLILVAKLCPVGIEASLYSTFVGLINFAGIVSTWGGAYLTDRFDVTYDNFDNLEQLIMVCSATSLVPLLFVCFVPKGSLLQYSRVPSGLPYDDDDDTASIELTKGDDV